jgi:hypothetical protein
LLVFARYLGTMRQPPVRTYLAFSVGGGGWRGHERVFEAAVTRDSGGGSAKVGGETCFGRSAGLPWRCAVSVVSMGSPLVAS